MNDAAKKRLLCSVLCLAVVSPGGDAMNWKQVAANIRQVGALVTGKASLADVTRAFARGLDVDSPLATTMRRPYAQSVWVHSAVNHVTQPLKAVGVKFYRDDVEVEDARLMAFWRSPARRMTWEAFLEATAGWYQIAGEFFWLLDDTWQGRNKTRGQLILARPSDMREVVRGGVLEGWVWTDAAGRQHAFLPEDVIQEKTWNPYNHWRGLGRMDAAKLAAETDFFAGRFARDTYANAGELGDYIVAKGGRPTPEQEDQIIQALREKRAAKLRGDNRPMLLSADLEPKSPTVTSPDASFVATRVSTRDEIYVAFGVPPSMATPTASYSIGSASDFFRLILSTCIPLGNTIAGAMDRLADRISDKAGLLAFFDFDEHPVMQAVRAERIDAAAKLFGFGMPVREINDYLDMGLKPFPGWDVGYIPFSAGSPIEAGSGKPEGGSENEEPAETDPVAEMFKALRGPLQVKLIANKPVPECRADDPRARLWLSHHAKRRAAVKGFHSKMKRVLIQARAEVLAKIAKEAGKTVVGKSVAADFLFDLIGFKGSLRVEMRKAAIAVLTQAGQELFAEVGKDDVFTMPPQRALSFLSTRENLMTDVADEVFDQVKGGLQDGLNAGDTMAQLANRVREKFRGIEKGRAMTVAQTETAAAYGVSRAEAMEQAGVQYKQWLTSRNENVRPSHRAAEGQTVPLHEPFHIGDGELQHPGDPYGPPEEVINCHCVQIAVAKPEEKPAA